jgi:hypothetical protein
MENIHLLNELVSLYIRLTETVELAGQSTNDIEFERLIADVRMMRQRSAELRAKLDATAFGLPLLR